MKMLSTLTLAIAAALLIGCASTPEKVTSTPGEPIDSSAAWASLDPDSNGVLSLDELEQQRAMGLLEDFHGADTDHDGQISKAEWDVWWPRMTDHSVQESAATRPVYTS